MTGGAEPNEMARKMESELQGLHGIQDVRITMSPRGEVSEVHVVADSTRRGKELVRDIETVLLAAFDVEVDHRRISVARMGPDQAVLAPTDIGRVRLSSVGLQVGESGGTAHVELVRNGVDASGSSSGSAIGGAWQRLVAGATLEAAGRFLPGGVGVALGNVSRSHVGFREVILVTVDFAGAKEMRELVGSAFLGPDIHRSVAQATLDALNRVLTRTDSQIETITYLEPPL